MHSAIAEFIFHYGYWAVAASIALESMGLPVPGETTLIGFCGAPWTVATYMIAGHGTPDQAPGRLFGLGIRGRRAKGATFGRHPSLPKAAISGLRRAPSRARLVSSKLADRQRRRLRPRPARQQAPARPHSAVSRRAPPMVRPPRVTQRKPTTVASLA